MVSPYKRWELYNFSTQFGFGFEIQTRDHIKLSGPRMGSSGRLTFVDILSDQTNLQANLNNQVKIEFRELGVDGGLDKNKQICLRLNIR